MEMLFLMCAVIGGTILVCQFIMTALGIVDDGGDTGGGDFDTGNDVHLGHIGDADVGDVDLGDVDGTHSLSEAAEVDVQHPSTVWLFEMISLRTIVAAFAFFGLAGKASLEAGLTNIQALAVAIVVGWLAMYAVYSMMRALSRLQSKGNVRIANATGARGLVYVPIPGNRSGTGKVTIKLQNRTMEYQAQTDEEETIPTGTAIIVVEVLGPDLLKIIRVTESIQTVKEQNV